MSQVPPPDIAYVARLARIELDADECRRFGAQLGDVLHHIGQLKQVDVAGVEPTAHACPVGNIWHEDVARPGLDVAAALRNAPARRDNMFSVPKVLE